MFERSPREWLVSKSTDKAQERSSTATILRERERTKGEQDWVVRGRAAKKCTGLKR